MKTNHQRGFKGKKHSDKGGQGWAANGSLSGVRVGASVGFNFTNGNRGMAKSVRGAKKFVRSRIRFHENAATQRLARQHDEG